MFDIAICDASIRTSFRVMLLIMRERVGLHYEAEEVGDGGDDHEGLGTLLDQRDVEYQHDDGEGHLDTFIEIVPGQFGDLGVEVLFHQGAVKSPEDHVKVGRCDHPIVPPFFLAEEAQ